MKYRIDGYWADKWSENFTGYVVSEDHNYADNDEVFFHGLSREIAESLIDTETAEDFVITEVYDY